MEGKSSKFVHLLPQQNLVDSQNVKLRHHKIGKSLNLITTTATHLKIYKQAKFIFSYSDYSKTFYTKVLKFFKERVKYIRYSFKMNHLINTPFCRNVLLKAKFKLIAFDSMDLTSLLYFQKIIHIENLWVGCKIQEQTSKLNRVEDNIIQKVLSLNLHRKRILKGLTINQNRNEKLENYLPRLIMRFCFEKQTPILGYHCEQFNYELIKDSHQSILPLTKKLSMYTIMQSKKFTDFLVSNQNILLKLRKLSIQFVFSNEKNEWKVWEQIGQIPSLRKIKLILSRNTYFSGEETSIKQFLINFKVPQQIKDYKLEIKAMEFLPTSFNPQNTDQFGQFFNQTNSLESFCFKTSMQFSKRRLGVPYAIFKNLGNSIRHISIYFKVSQTFNIEDQHLDFGEFYLQVQHLKGILQSIKIESNSVLIDSKANWNSLRLENLEEIEICGCVVIGINKIERIFNLDNIKFIKFQDLYFLDDDLKKEFLLEKKIKYDYIIE